MAEVERLDSLEIGQDLAFQRREWALQRFGWVAMAATILAALLGLTGRGWLSQATADAEGDAFRLEYERFERLQAPTTLRVRLSTAATGGEQTEVWLARDYVDGIMVETIEPEPQEVRVGAERMTYVIAIERPGEPLAVTFHLRPTEFGRRSGRVGLPDGPSLSFAQVVYP